MAISASGSPRRFTTLTYIEGSYVVTLPPGFSTDMPIVGHVSPRGYEIETIDGRDQITWDSVTSGSVVVQSYRETDLLVFGVILVIAAIAAVIGTVYFRRQLEELRERRRQMGLGVYEETTRTTNSSPSVGGNFAFGLAPFSVRDALCGYGRRNCHRRGRTPRR